MSGQDIEETDSKIECKNNMQMRNYDLINKISSVLLRDYQSLVDFSHRKMT